MRAAWLVALCFLLPSLALTLLLQYALWLDPGVGRPFVGVGVLVLPLIGAARNARAAFGRGLIALGALSLFFSAAVHLRVLTHAGAPVLEREGLLGPARLAIALGLLALLVGVLLMRPRRRAPAMDRPAPIE